MKMKKIYALALLVLMVMASCFKDDGNYSYNEIGDITISNIETAYSAYSYMGDVLEISPVVETDYANMKYEWYIWEGTELGFITDESEEQEMTLIGEEKDLSYEVNLAPGDYTLLFRATSEDNGYASIQTLTLEVSTQFARGFYILKETADGNTELDLHYQDGVPVIENMLEATGQAALVGAPLAMGPVYSQGYIDTESNTVETCNAIFVTTDAGQLEFYNSEDMTVIHDNADVAYGGLASDVIPYMAYTLDGMYNHLVTSKGLYTVMNGAMGMPSSAYAYSGGEGGSLLATACWASLYGMSVAVGLIWDEQNQCINCWDSYGFFSSNENGFSTAGMSGLMCGYTKSNSKAYLLCENGSGERYLYEIGVNGMTYQLDIEKQIDLSDASRLSQSELFALNAEDAAYLYFVSDNKLYAYSLANYSELESPFTLDGIASDEEIVYLSYQTVNCLADAEAGTNFKHLIVGTQKDDTYHVYMYNVAGGEPQTLVRTISGIGKLKSVAYITPRFDAYTDTASLSNS